jgi:hypothetical protein
MSSFRREARIKMALTGDQRELVGLKGTKSSCIMWPLEVRLTECIYKEYPELKTRGGLKEICI